MKIPSINVYVENLHNKNQFVIKFKTTKGDDWSIFQSYSSECALYNSKSRKLYLNRNCWLSKTTSKHLYIFINEYTPFSAHNRKELEELIIDGDCIEYTR